MTRAVHHSALCVSDLDASRRFYTEGLGLEVLMDESFEGDWPTLFAAPSTRLRSIFLGDPARPDAGIVELVQFEGGVGVGDATGPPTSGFFLLSFFVGLDATLERLAALGYRDVRRIEQSAPGGAVSMATLTDPDGVRIELIDTPGR